MNRYNGSTGRVTKYGAEQRKSQPLSQKPVRQCAKRDTPKTRDLGDIWVLAVFFLLYMESRDTDFLIILAVLAVSMFDVGDILKKFGLQVQ